MIQRAYWPDVRHWVSAVESDIQNAGTALAKIDLFFSVRKQVGELNVGYYVTTEFEYVIGVCRSMLDALQETLRRLWVKIRLLDPSVKKREMPQSFASVVLSGDKPQHVATLVEKYGLPEPLARCYANAAAFFAVLKELRDGILHGGQDGPRVLVADRGFIIDRAAKPFADLGVWDERSFFNDHSASLRPVLAHVVLRAVSICSEFASVLEQIFRFPGPCAPGYAVFMRGPHNQAVIDAMKALGDDPWWS
jgi:hypothetical protein